VHEQAVDRFDYHEGQVVFRTRFSGQSVEVVIPFAAVIAIFTRETHEGLHLHAMSKAESEDTDAASQAETKTASKSARRAKPHLTVVK